ncbi:putative threonine/serine exporter [Bifidobacterium animalis subsp. lactis]|uniref:threonine/serine exporter family protein n=1 Tax=Bifidobacterium animalis TaxID=28025 RepID=UPI0010E6823C|nr:threonine/serine exporter family protein [Bifidobacterium animalis]RYM94964.1 putative threonine/serine exporter [Bifidobacterium animalis subsp. lactis]RYM95040.1 putative threonine/serine exporter [Bifidobacterium animalis subsp. lactis]
MSKSEEESATTTDDMHGHDRHSARVHWRSRPVKSAAGAVHRFHSHAIPLDMKDIERDWDKPITDAGIAAKASVIVRVGMLDLGAGTGSFRVREMMHRIAYPLGVHVRADVNLTDIQASCTDGKERITEVVNLPTTGVNTERIWLLEHFADWFSVNLGVGSMYHRRTEVSRQLMQPNTLGTRDASQISAETAKQLRERLRQEARAQKLAAKRASLRSRVAERVAERAKKKLPEDEYAEHFDHLEEHAEKRVREHGPITVGQVHKRLDLIERRKPLYSPAFSGFAAACACAAFVFLLGGAPYDMIGAFIGAGLGQWARRRLFAHHLNQFFVTFVAVAVAALACVGTLRLIGIFDPVALHHDTAYIGAMLFVIPGFPLITGGLDMAKIDFPSGVQRIAYVCCIILMATLAGWMVAVLVHLNPQGFDTPPLNPWATGALRALFAFVGVWGFSVLFNSPQRMCLVAATIGMITDTLRLELVDWGVPAEAGAFIGALLAGLIASAWRSAVRHGLLAPHLGYPRICLTVPSIVIMVPGLYMYRAMFYLGQFNTLLALDWAFRAFMVIICLPIGLAMARVITDKSWRYDV